MIFCMKCGSKLPEEARFCKYCGTSTEVSGGTVLSSVRIKPSQKIPTEGGGPDEDLTNNKTASVFEHSRKKTNAVYVDHDFHGGLARKNIGGEYVESKDDIVGGKWGFVDVSGKEVIPVIYDRVSIFKDGFAKASLNEKWGILNKKGEDVIPLIYSDTTYISEGMAGVCMNGKWGFVDSKGNKMIPFKYSHVAPFENGMAGVCKNGKWGFIDKRDRILVPFMYNDANQVENYKKTNNRLEKTDDYKHSLLYNITAGSKKIWAAVFGEAIFLLIIRFMLPAEKNNTFWSLAFLTIIVSFILFLFIIDAIKEKIEDHKMNN